MIELRGYIDEKGNKRFALWLESLDATAAAKVAISLTRMEQGNFSNAKGVGAGVYECKIDFGPGYRIYFGREGDRIVILIGGGTKKRQNKEIQAAQQGWADSSEERNRRFNNAPYPRLQGDHPGEGAARSRFPTGAPARSR